MEEKKEKKKESIKQITIAPIRVQDVIVKINGKTPLLMDKMRQEVKDDILGKQTGVTKSNKKLRDTKKEVAGSNPLYSKWKNRISCRRI